MGVSRFQVHESFTIILRGWICVSIQNYVIPILKPVKFPNGRQLWAQIYNKAPFYYIENHEIYENPFLQKLENSIAHVHK